jgi:ABC-2 type transport system permease protein
MNQEKDPQISATEENTSAAETENTKQENPEAAPTEAAAKETASENAETETSAEEKKEAASETEGKKDAKEEKKKPSFFQSEKFKHGSTATAFTAIFIAVVVLVNVLFSILSDKFPSINFDVTKNGTNTLSSQCIEVIDKVKIPVEITICASKENCEANNISSSDTVDYPQVSRLFSKAAERNSNITLSYVDLDKNPSFAANYKSDNLQEGDVVVKSDKRYRVLSSSDLFETTYSSDYTSQTTTSKVDSCLASALNTVISEDVPIASFDTGHSEQIDAEGYKHLLQNNSFETKDFNLLTEDIPENTQLLVLGCPANDLTDDEVEKVDKWLHNKTLKMDRALLVTTSAGVTSLDNLNDLLNEWGLSADTSEAIEEQDDTKFYQSPFNIYTTVQSSLDLSGKKSSYESVFATNIVPVTIKAASVGNKTTYSLLKTSDKSVVVKATEDNTTTTSEPAAQNAAALSRESITIDQKQYYSSVILCGSTTLFSSSLLGTDVFGNASFLGDLSRYATGTTDSASAIYTQSHELYTKDLAINSQTVNGLGYGVFTILIPLIVMIAGIIVYRKRRTL